MNCPVSASVGLAWGVCLRPASFQGEAVYDWGGSILPVEVFFVAAIRLEIPISRPDCYAENLLFFVLFESEK